MSIHIVCEPAVVQRQRATERKKEVKIERIERNRETNI